VGQGGEVHRYQGGLIDASGPTQSGRYVGSASSGPGPNGEIDVMGQ
jgi:hypothetical protein